MFEPQVIFFDLFETLVTEFVPGRPEAPTPANRLGIDEETYRRVWRSYSRQRMTRAIDYKDVLRRVCQAAGVEFSEPIRAVTTSMRDVYAIKGHRLVESISRC